MKTAAARSRVALVLQSVLGSVCAVLLGGCSESGPSEVAQGKVIVKGSNTIGEELAPRLISEYRKEQPKVSVELESKGTGSGIAALLAGQCDIAAASRVVSPV